MQFIGSKQARIGFLAAGVALSGALAGSAQASVVTPTASLPLIGIPYVSPPPGAGCFTIATACVNPGAFILTNPVIYSYSGGDQIITAGVTYDATLTPPMETNIIGSVDLAGTVEMTVIGRASNTETGSFTVDITELSLSGPLSLSGSPLDGRTLMVGLDASETSSGTTTIVADGAAFKIDSFFDVFADITLDLPTTSPSTSVGPIFLVAVPEPSSWALALLGFAGLAFAAYRRPIHRRSSTAATRPCG